MECEHDQKNGQTVEWNIPRYVAVVDNNVRWITRTKMYRDFKRKAKQIEAVKEENIQHILHTKSQVDYILLARDQSLT